MTDSQGWCDRLEEYWSTEHQTEDSDFVSNSPPTSVLSRHEISVTPGETVLDIGVGNGQMAHYLHNESCLVHSMDISPVALEKVKDVAKHCWLVTDSLPKDTFDLAICHLVAQHVADVDLIPQLENIFQSLKSGKILSIQFASNPAVVNQNQTYELCRGGGVVRTVEESNGVIERAGGTVVREIHLPPFTETKTLWHVFHCHAAGKG